MNPKYTEPHKLAIEIQNAQHTLQKLEDEYLHKFKGSAYKLTKESLVKKINYLVEQFKGLGKRGKIVITTGAYKDVRPDGVIYIQKFQVIHTFIEPEYVTDLVAWEMREYDIVPGTLKSEFIEPGKIFLI